MVKPFNPHSSIKAPAVRGPPGFLKTEPAHGWSNGVPAFRHRSRRACNSLSLAGGSSISASFASSTITLPRFDERYLNEICLRGTCRIFPLASITEASVSTSANSAPCAPARSEEHTSELQSHHDLVCRLLLEKKKEQYSSMIQKLNEPHYQQMLEKMSKIETKTVPYYAFANSSCRAEKEINQPNLTLLEHDSSY